ncbi:MAG: TolC family protein [bacterium]
MKKYLFVMLTVVLSISTFAQTKITLDESIKIALQRNSSLIKAKNGLDANQSQIKNSYGEFLPSLGVNGTWGWQKVSDKGSTQLNEFGVPTGQKESTVDNRSYSVSAGGSWTLFDGLSSFAGLDRSKNNFEAAKYELAKLKQDIVYQTTDLYYTVLNAKELLKVRDDNVKYNQKLLETIQERKKLGATAIADVYAQQVQLGNAELLFIQAGNDYEIAKSNLLNYLALDVFKEYDYISPIDENSANVDSFLSDFASIENMVNEALNSRPDYKSQKLILESTYNSVTIAKSGLYPSLNGNYSFSTNAIQVGDLMDRKIWNVGLTLSIPIFSNWSTENAIQQAQVQSKNSEEDLSALERQIKIEIKQGYQDLTAAKKQFEVSGKNIIAAEENRKINNEKYSLGSGTILDVLLSDKNYVDAQRSYIDAQFLFYKMKDKLVNALGKLDYKKYE